jgi:hypothetical protein
VRKLCFNFIGAAGDILVNHVTDQNTVETAGHRMSVCLEYPAMKTRGSGDVALHT